MYVLYENQNADLICMYENLNADLICMYCTKIKNAVFNMYVRKSKCSI